MHQCTSALVHQCTVGRVSHGAQDVTDSPRLLIAVKKPTRKIKQYQSTKSRHWLGWRGYNIALHLCACTRLNGVYSNFTMGGKFVLPLFSWVCERSEMLAAGRGNLTLSTLETIRQHQWPHSSLFWSNLKFCINPCSSVARLIEL